MHCATLKRFCVHIPTHLYRILIWGNSYFSEDSHFRDVEVPVCKEVIFFVKAALHCVFLSIAISFFHQFESSFFSIHSLTSLYLIQCIFEFASNSMKRHSLRRDSAHKCISIFRYEKNH